MNLPKIDLASLPDLSHLSDAIVSLAHPAQAGGISDDSLIDLMVFVYNTIITI